MGMHSKLLSVCCAVATNDQVMYLRSDKIAIAMGEIKTSAARPSDNLLNPASPSNFRQKYQHSQGLSLQAAVQNSSPTL